MSFPHSFAYLPHSDSDKCSGAKPQHIHSNSFSWRPYKTSSPQSVLLLFISYTVHNNNYCIVFCVVSNTAMRSVFSIIFICDFIYVSMNVASTVTKCHANIYASDTVSLVHEYTQIFHQNPLALNWHIWCNLALDCTSWPSHLSD